MGGIRAYVACLGVVAVSVGALWGALYRFDVFTPCVHPAADEPCLRSPGLLLFSSVAVAVLGLVLICAALLVKAETHDHH